ncbi:hypothetical protein PBY51_024696 [Eleginops maclovinus]|uniref:Uncharacterized protein n=1 Tax=Eleginops maclovinus TaxID=56733 RepID=A0AAN7XTY7_ELEMC|nr:hypothetical protein PBY51_024696 [Eleginops maclovinus]
MVMESICSSLAMDGENYLHPEGPQLDSSLFSVASPNIESSIYPSSGSWGSYSQQPGYNIHCPMQSGNQQYHLNSSTTTTTTPDVHMDMYSGFPDVDFSGLNLPRNGDFPQLFSLVFRHSLPCEAWRENVSHGIIMTNPPPHTRTLFSPSAFLPTVRTAC